MRLDRRMILRLILLVCVSFIVTRVAGNHMHLCFDGSEPPVSLHAVDADAHHSEPSAEHNDQDISLPEVTPAKIASFLLDAALIASLFLCVVLLLTPQGVRPEFLETYLRPSLLHFLRPPLRGPPAVLLH